MRLKILFLSHVFTPSIGGIETSSLFLADAFVAAGYQVRLLTMTAGTTNELTYPVFRTPSLGEMIRQHAWADVVFENNPCLRLGWPKIFFRSRSVVVLHTWIDFTHIYGKLKLHWLARASKVIAISEALRQRCWPEASVIHNSYDNSLFVLCSQERRNDFVFLGRLVSDKGAELAIRAFSAVVFLDPLPGLETATLTIVGDGQDRQYLESLVNTLPVSARIRFVGPLRGEALVKELNKHSFQFIPSTWKEPFGILALEGIACGLIPIAADCGGLPDAIGSAGVTFQRGQLDSLVDAVKQLVTNTEQQEKYRAAAQEHLAKFRPESIAYEFTQVLLSVSRQPK